MNVRKPIPDWLNKIPDHLSRPLRYVTFGEVIARHRKSQGFTQAEFAAKVGISRNYVSLIERDMANNLSVAILLSVARELRIDKCDLLKIYAAQPNFSLSLTQNQRLSTSAETVGKAADSEKRNRQASYIVRPRSVIALVDNTLSGCQDMDK